MTSRTFLSRASNRLKDLLFLPGTEGYWTRRLSGRVLALLYHRVVATDEHTFLTRGGTPTTALDSFDADISFLQKLGATFLTFDDIRRGVQSGIPGFGVAITFDDGFLDTYRTALPCLEARGIRATVFQCTGMIDAPRLLLEHQYYWWGSAPEASGELARTAARRGWPALGESEKAEQAAVNPAPWICTVPLTELEMVRGLMEARFPIPADLPGKLYPASGDLNAATAHGHEIGSHGHGHLHRATLTEEAFKADIDESALVLRRILGPRPLAYSFPYNARTPSDSAVCLRHFDLLATVEPRTIGRDFDPTEVPRSTWPATRSRLRNRRWLLTGAI
jgi:peptidoglycan/xylan/chitin deacetylase (PgdA/CDA1 family)